MKGNFLNWHINNYIFFFTDDLFGIFSVWRMNIWTMLENSVQFVIFPLKRLLWKMMTSKTQWRWNKLWTSRKDLSHKRKLSNTSWIHHQPRLQTQIETQEKRPENFLLFWKSFDVMNFIYSREKPSFWGIKIRKLFIGYKLDILESLIVDMIEFIWYLTNKLLQSYFIGK